MLRAFRALLSFLSTLTALTASAAVNVRLDLARLPHDTDVIVTAPASTPYQLQIINRAPTGNYTVTVGTVSYTIAPVSVTNATPVTGGGPTVDRYLCPNLQSYPLAGLCVDGAGGPTCVKDEMDVGEEVTRLRTAAATCGSVQLAVLAAIESHTTYLLPGTVTGDTTVKIVRTDVAATWNLKLTSCDPRTQLLRFMDKNHPTEVMNVLAFDFETQLWSSYLWKKPNLQDVGEPRFKRNITGAPRLALAPEQNLTVIVTNVDPIAYTAATTERTRAAVEDLATLQQMALLFGDLVTGGLRVAGDSNFTIPFGVAGSPQTAMMVTRATAFYEEDVPPPPAIPPEDDDPILRGIAKEFAEELKKYVDEPAKQIGAVNKISKDILKKSEQLTERTNKLASFVQRVEDRSADLAIPAGITALPVTHKQLADAVDALELARTTLRANPPKCAGPLAAASEIVQLRLKGRPTGNDARMEITNRFLSLLNDLEPPMRKEDDDCSPAMRNLIDRLRGWMAEPGHALGGKLNNVQRETLVRLAQDLAVVNALIAKRETVLTAANDVLAKQPALAKATSSLQSLTKRLEPYVDENVCALLYGVIELPRPEGRLTTIPWTKVQTETMKIVPEAAFKDSVRLAHGETSSKYELARLRRSTFDVDIAATYTDIVDPIFGAVTIDSKLYPARVDEKTHTGDLAMFLTMRPLDRNFGAQLGIGLNGYPAAFLGGAVKIGPYVKISAGGTAQRVKTLGGGQKEGKTVITAKDDIRTRDTFDTGWYAALSITVDDLPFFKKP